MLPRHLLERILFFISRVRPIHPPQTWTVAFDVESNLVGCVRMLKAAVESQV